MNGLSLEIVFNVLVKALNYATYRSKIRLVDEKYMYLASNWFSGPKRVTKQFFESKILVIYFMYQNKLKNTIEKLLN